MKNSQIESQGSVYQEGLSPTDRKSQPAKLSPRQMRTLPIIVTATNLTQAAQEAGISEATLRRWRREPQFRAELDRLASELAETTAQELKSTILHGFQVINELMEDSDPMVRLRAARVAITLGGRTIELDKLLKTEAPANSEREP